MMCTLIYIRTMYGKEAEAEVWNAEENGLYSYHGAWQGYEQNYSFFHIFRILYFLKYSGVANV